MLLTFTYLLLLAFGGLTFNALLFAPIAVLDFIAVMMVGAYLGVGGSSTDEDLTDFPE